MSTTKPFPCIESTLEFKIGNRIIRLWINENEVKDDYNLEVLHKELYTHLNTFSFTNKEIVSYLSKTIPNLNAVQIKANGLSRDFGVVAYLVDFENHG